MDKKKILINSSSDIQELLKKNFDLVYESEFRYKDAPNDFDFDLYLNIDGIINENLDKYCELYNIPSIGSKRYGKSLQHLILKKLNINTPETYFNNSYGKNSFDSNTVSSFLLVELLLDINDNEKLIIKMENGARGLGQMLSSKKEFINFALNGFSFNKDNHKKSSLELEPLSSYKDDRRDNISYGNENIRINGSEYLKFRKNEFIIQKYLNLKKEYRYIYFYGQEPILIERKKDEKNWQANSCITGFGKHVKFINKIPNIENIHLKVNQLADYLNVPFLSTDIYVDDKDNFGLLEFQMEFGISKVPHDLLVEKINNSVLLKSKL